MFINEVNEIGQFIPMHYHFQMLSDTDRMNAFIAAIKQVVKPGHRVVELGSGTGVLSFNAAKQGAKVWAVEYNPTLVSASRKFISDNGLSDKIQVFHGDATAWLPPEPADVVICEMLHSALLREKQVEVISKFRDAHKARFGVAPKMLPNATLLAAQPVWQNYDFNGFYAPVPFFQSAYAAEKDCTQASGPAVYKIVDYDNAQVETYKADILFPINQDTKVNALRFITKSLLAIDYKSGQTVDWHNQHILLPLSESYELKAGQALRVHFAYQPGDAIEDLNNAIDVEITDKAGTVKRMTMIA